MASDQVVTAQDVLRSLIELRRLGSQRVLQDLEQQEGDLVEFLLEELSGVHQDILALGGKPGRSRRLVQRVESMALVLVTALRQAQLRLWRQDAAGGRLAEIDPSLRADAPGGCARSRPV